MRKSRVQFRINRVCKNTVCYFCQDQEPHLGKEPYIQKKYHVCTECTAKLYHIANQGVMFQWKDKLCIMAAFDMDKVDFDEDGNVKHLVKE